MRVLELLEKRRYLVLLVLGLGALMLILDFFNPLTDFFQSWNLHYSINHLGGFLSFFAPFFLILGFFSGLDESFRLFIWFLWVPVVFYVFKGFLFIYFIIQDPGLDHVIGAWFGGVIVDWGDFALIYTAEFYMWMWGIGAICIIIMFLGLVLGHLFGPDIKESLEGALKGSKEQGSEEDLSSPQQ